MIVDGNLLFNKNKYELAAKQYEGAGQWATIELGDKEIVKTSFELAINAWISACRCEKAFLILERLPHENVNTILFNVSDKIVAAADFLVSIGKLSEAKDQLYYSVFTYQKQSLFKYLKKFAIKLLDILIKILDKSIQNEEIYKAKFTYDEIENIWETFKLEKTNLDDYLEKLIILFLDDIKSSMASILINKLNSLELKKKLTKYSSKLEEKSKIIEKKVKDEKIKNGIEILKEYVKEELNIIAEINVKKLYEANNFIEQNDWLKAATHIKIQADFLRKIGKQEIENQILTKSLDILLDGKLFNNFFEYFDNLEENFKKSYLIQVFPVYLEKLSIIKNNKNLDDLFEIFDKSIFIYRNQELYEESKKITKIYIEAMKRESLRLIRAHKDLSGIEITTNLIKKILDISSAYLDNVSMNFDEIYKEIAEIYAFKIGDLSSALAYNDKIEDKSIKINIHKKIAKIEAKKSASSMKAAKESSRETLLKEEFSIIEQKAQDALRDQAFEFKQRIGFKRAYFNEILKLINERNYNASVKLYRKSMTSMMNSKKYYLSSVSFAMICLIHIIKNNFDEIYELIKEIEQSSSNKLLLETFPVILIQYIIEIHEINDEKKFNQALLLMNNLPLFEEEKRLLDEFIKQEFKGKEPETKVSQTKKKTLKSENPQDIMKKMELEQQFSKLQQKMIDTKTESNNFLTKRNAMRRRYYDDIITSLENKEYNEAAEKYYILAKETAKRKDFNTSTLSILLYGLSSLSLNIPDEKIESRIEEYLDNLGLNKPLVKDTYEISLILSIIKTKQMNITKYDSQIKKMIEILPLFDEEKKSLLIGPI